MHHLQSLSRCCLTLLVILAAVPVCGQEAKRGASTVLLRGLVVDADGQPVPDATIRSLRPLQTSPLEISTNARGAFVKRVPADNPYYGIPLLAESADGKLASFISSYDYHVSDEKPFKITLRPKQSTTIEVTDENDQAIADADLYLIAAHTEIARTRSNAEGKAVFDFPSDAPVDWVVALKSGRGLDYYENYDAFPTSDRLKVPKQLSLKLDGAVNIQVNVQGSQGEPVEGIRLMPWTIKREGKLSYVNLSGIELATSPPDGICTFDWIPSRVERGVTFLGHSEDYHCPKNPHYDFAKPDKTELTMTVFRNPIVRGQVTYEDGTPAVGVRIQGEGRGDTNMYFRGYCSTDNEGRYEMKIYPDQTTILAITEDDVAAKSVTDLLLAEGKVAEDVDFVLGAGTLVTGLITMGDEKKPVAKQTATLIQTGNNQAHLVRWNDTDEDGRYRFRVGPGTYDLRLVDGPTQQIVVDNEKELTFDRHIDRLPRGRLTGTVVDERGNPASGVEVYGESIEASGHAGFSTKTDEAGKLATERWRDKMFVQAIDSKRDLVGSQVIDPDDETVHIKMEAAGRVSGTTVDAEGKPVSCMVFLMQAPPPGDGKRPVRRQTRSDDQGRFEFGGVSLKISHQVIAFQESETKQVGFTIDDGTRKVLEPIVLGESDSK